MANKRSLKPYEVSAIIRVWSGVKVSAESFEDALSKARTFKVEDFVDVHGDVIDSEIELQAIAEYDVEL